MKGKVWFLCLAMTLLLFTLTAFAGDVPESLMYEDGAKIFFGEVTAYQPGGEKPYIEVSPFKVIKGDVENGISQTSYNFIKVGDFEIKRGKVYLFTYFDENNSTYIFETTTMYTATLKLKNTTGDMWERFEEYLNAGKYEEAELERVGKLEDYQKVKNARVLADLLVFDRSDVDKIEVIYPGEGDPRGVYVDKDKFFDIAETISLDAVNRIDEVDKGVIIVAIDKDSNRHSIWLDEKHRIGCTEYETSSAVTTQYDISRGDYIKMYAFLPQEATAHIPLKNPMKKYIAMAVGGSVLAFLTAFMIGFVIKKKRS